MTSPFRTRLHEILEYLDPRVRARPQRNIDWILAAGVNSYDDLLALVCDRSAAVGIREAGCGLLIQLDARRAVPALLAILQDGGEVFDVRHAAARAVGMLADHHTADELAALLSAPGDPHLCFWAAYALSARGDERALKPLIERLNDEGEDARVRGLAAEALASVAHKDEDDHAFHALLEALGEPAPEVRFWAAFALGAVGDARALPALERVAMRDRSTVFGHRSVGQEAAEAIEGIRVWEQFRLENPD